MSPFDKQPASTISNLDEVSRISWPDVQAVVDEVHSRLDLTASVHMSRYCAPDNPSAA